MAARSNCETTSGVTEGTRVFTSAFQRSLWSDADIYLLHHVMNHVVA